MGEPAGSSAGRVLRVAEAFAAQPPGPAEARLCAAAAELVEAPGVGLSLGATPDVLVGGLETICATDGGRDGEALQFDLGEGPAYVAHRTGAPVQVADLARCDRWPAFGSAAVRAGVRAVFAFPLRSGSVTLGALTFYRDVAGELTTDQYADASVVARVAVNLVISSQAGRPPDELDSVLVDGLSSSVEVHQAAGIVSVQLEIPVAAALAVLRAHAFTRGCSITELATEVVEHRLRLDPLPGEP